MIRLRRQPDDTWSAPSEFVELDEEEFRRIETVRPKETAGGCESLGFFKKDDGDQIFGFGGRTDRPNRTGSTADLFAIKVRTERGIPPSVFPQHEGIRFPPR